MNALSVENAKNNLSKLTEVEKISILKTMVLSIPDVYDYLKRTMDMFLEEAENGDKIALNLATDRILNFWFIYDAENPKNFFS